MSPITGEVVAQVAAGDSADVDRAVAGARAAFESGAWSRLAPKKRKRVLQKLAGLMSEHAEELALLETIDMGKPIRDATNVDVPLATECIALVRRGDRQGLRRDRAHRARRARVDRARATRGRRRRRAVELPAPDVLVEARAGARDREQRHPQAGGAVASDGAAARRARASEAGLPDGVLQVVPGFGETAGQALGRHPDVDMIAFTGSTEVGKLFLRYSGESNMKRVALECGGKSPHIVTKECGDLDAAATAVAWGVFYNQGEVCNAGSRLLVHSAVKDELLEKVVAGRRPDHAGRPARPEDADGRDRRRDPARRACSATSSRARARAPGSTSAATASARTRGGYYVEPTIFDAVSNDMTIAREEIFGPVLSAISFDELDDAITIANDTIYGLSAGIWTDDVNVAHRAARAIRAGIVWVNTFDAGDISSPFGGFKQSGFGRDKSIHALEKFTDLKAIWIALRD